MAYAVLNQLLMSNRALIALLLATACGGSSSRGPTSPMPTPTVQGPVVPALVPQIAEQRWFGARVTCGQGPYEIVLPVDGSRWEQEVELRLATPRNVQVFAIMLVDGTEVARTSGVFTASGVGSGAPDNRRCVADTRERLTTLQGGSGGGTGVVVTPGTEVVVAPPPTPSVTPILDLDESFTGANSTLLRFQLRERTGRVTIKLWSIEPNDLLDVRFGAIRVHWVPNVGEAAWDAHLAEQERLRIEQARVDEERRREREQRRAEQMRIDRERYEAAWKLDQERRERERAEAAKKKKVVVVIDREAEARRARERAEDERRRAEEERRQREEDHKRAEEERRRAEEARARAEAERRRIALELALEADRVQRRKEFCAAHHENRDCWGAGGFRMHAAFEQREQERETYCAAHPEDARCWSERDRTRRSATWNARIAAALAPPSQPDGPPPAPLADAETPRPSENAEWRPGYWQWIGQWVWLVGQWRVPESDITEDKTARAPAPPPPPKTEVVVVAPARSMVWVPGYWMWNTTSWVWIPGVWQVRPAGTVRWRTPEWRARGSIHVLIPGGWTR